MSVDLHSQQQQAQAALVSLVLADLRRAFPQLDPADLKATLPRFTTLVYSLVHKYAPLSGALAGRYYQAARREVGLPTIRPQIAGTPSAQQVAKTVQWATSQVWADPSALPAAQAKIGSSVARLVQDVGRQTVIATSKDDPEARGWARLTEPDPCAFCALLAARGGVYTKRTASFKSHDDCRCIPYPEFRINTPELKAANARAAQWAAEYKTATKGQTGGGTNLLNAWRRHYEAKYLRPETAAQPTP